MDKLEDMLNSVIIGCSDARGFFIGGDARMFLNTFAKRINSPELQRCSYEAICRFKNNSVFWGFIVMLSLGYFYMEGKFSSFLRGEIGEFDDIAKRFVNDSEFGLTLVKDYLDYYCLDDRKPLAEYAKDNGLFLDVDFEGKNKPKQNEVVMVDELVFRAFESLKRVLETTVSDPLEMSASILALKYLPEDETKADPRSLEKIRTLKTYYPVFLRMMYAEVYGALLTGTILVEDDFRKEFDNHIINKDYTTVDIAYEGRLMANYITALNNKDRNLLDENKIKLLRGIYPLYH